jgi:hypothetical protein
LRLLYKIYHTKLALFKIHKEILKYFVLGDFFCLKLFSEIVLSHRCASRGLFAVLEAQLRSKKAVAALADSIKVYHAKLALFKVY